MSNEQKPQDIHERMYQFVIRIGKREKRLWWLLVQ